MTGPVILCVNHWHDDNKGDSAITQATLRLVRARWPSAMLRVVTAHEPDSPGADTAVRHIRRAFPTIASEPSLLPVETASRPPSLVRFLPKVMAHRLSAIYGAAVWILRLLPYLLALPVGPPRRVRTRLRDVDLVVAMGGSNLHDNPDVLAPFSVARLLVFLYPVWAAGRLGIPTVLFGHTLGPFPRRTARRLARYMLREVQATQLREGRSRPAAAMLGLREVSVGPDVALALTPDPSPRVHRILSELPEAAADSLVLVVRRHPHRPAAANQRLLAEFASLARGMLERAEVRQVLIVPQVLGPTEIEDDRPLSRELSAILQGYPVHLIEDDLTPAELSALYGACRLVVSVRLHAAILAMVGGAPAFAIAYFTAKTQGVMELCGFPHAWAPFDDATDATIEAQLSELLAPATRGRLYHTVHDGRLLLAQEVGRWRLQPGAALPEDPHDPSTRRPAQGLAFGLLPRSSGSSGGGRRDL